MNITGDIVMEAKNTPTPKNDVEIREALIKKQSITDKIIDSVIKTPTGKSRSEVLAKLSEDQQFELNTITENAIAGFVGQLNELESALGMLLMGHHFGWKVLYLIHSKKTIRKYEDILGVKIRDIFPETGPSSYRSTGLTLAMKASNFWKVVSGEHKIENLREIE
jgi:hypothetical protein